MPATDDTIVAVSSPPGRSARGLIRLAGPDTPRILRDLSTNHATQRAATVRERIATSDAASTSRSTSAPGDLPPPRTFARCELLINDDASAAALPVLLWHTVAPASYTGDHMAELQCPGNPALLDRLVHRIIAMGARPAEPGEFTFRAFLAGKIDLTQAEGISATISASSDSQLQAASLLREGRLGAFAASLVDDLATMLALVEAGIDFVDQDDVVPIGPDELARRLAAAVDRLDQLLARSRSWGALDAMPRVVLAGPPSVGKSTLFNALLGRDRAVVSATAGTTRDVLAEPMTLPDTHGRRVEIMLIDIAGLDRPEAMIDREAQAAAQRAMRTADLLLDITDGRPHRDMMIERPQHIPMLTVRTKCDLPGVGDTDSTILRLSAQTGAGLDALRAAIAARLGDRGVSVAADMLALQPRHEAGLRAAREHLRETAALLSSQRDGHALAHVELIADALRGALNELAALGGRMTPDDVIGRVFATFCIGK